MSKTQIKCVVFVIAILIPCFYSEEVRTDQRLRRDNDESLQRMSNILSAQNERLNLIQTMIVNDHLLHNCTKVLQYNLNLDRYLELAKECWIDLITQRKTAEQPTATEIQLLDQLVKDSYIGKSSLLPFIAMFIKDNVEKGSELARVGYRALLDIMNDFGQLYFEGTPNNHTFRTLTVIRDGEDESSLIYSQTLPALVNTILSGKEFFIRNNMTQKYLYAANSGSHYTNLLVDGVKENNPRYRWKLKAVDGRWKEHDEELFNIVSSFENKVLTVNQYARAVRELCINVLYSIGIVRGSIGDAVIIQIK